MKQFKGHVKQDADRVKIKTGDVEQILLLTYQKTGFGQKRFFLCPCCSARVQRLYWNSRRWACAKCNKVNRYKGIQNKTKGGYAEIQYRMQTLAEKNDIQFSFPFNYLDFALDPRMRKNTFRQCIKVLQALENMRFYSIMYHSTYKPKVIRMVTKGEHPLFQSSTLDDLKNNIYDWNKGNRVILPESLTNTFVKGVLKD